MENEIKIDEQLLTKTREIFQKYNESYFKLGQLRYEKLSLEERLSNIEIEEDGVLLEFKNIRTEEEKVVQEINEKYGKGNLNLETGTYIKV